MNYSYNELRFEIESLLFGVFIPRFYSEQWNYFNLGLPFELSDKIYSSLQSVGMKEWTFVSYQTHKMLQ